MILCEEYASRKGIVFPYARRSSVTHAFFGDEGKRISIRWESNNPRPGTFEISEFNLGSHVPRSSEMVQWEDFQSHITSWSMKNDSVVSDNNKVFGLVCSHFVVANEKLLSESFDPADVYQFLKESIIGSMNFLDEVADRSPLLYNFWQVKCVDILTNYGHWLSDLQKNNRRSCGN